MKKRILSLFLVAVMILSTFAIVPVTAAADVVEIGTYDELKALDAAVDGGNNYSGKTVILTADIAVNLGDWIGIGNGTTSFSGIFDGNGHTITFSGTGSDGYYADALFVYTDGATVKNLKLAGEVTIDGKSGNRVTGFLIGSTKGSATTVKNVQINARINYTSKVDTMGVFVGLVNAPTTFEGCVFDGIMNFGGQVTLVGSFVGQADKNVTIKDCVYAGTMMFNDSSYCANNAAFAGRVKACSASFTDCISIGTMTYSFNKASTNAILVGDLNSGATANATNFYYANIQKSDQSGSIALSGNGSVTTNNASAKTKAEIAALTVSAFSGNSTMTIGNKNGINLYYPCPAGLIPAEGGWLPSLTYMTGDAAVLGAQIRCTEEGDQYSGIRFVSIFKQDAVSGAQTADANFGIILISKAKYDNAENKNSIDALIAAGGLNVQATTADDESVDGYYRVNAVVYEITAAHYEDEIVAIAYIGDALVGSAVTRSIYQVATMCLADSSATVAQRDFCQEIVDAVNA